MALTWGDRSADILVRSQPDVNVAADKNVRAPKNLRCAPTLGRSEIALGTAAAFCLAAPRRMQRLLTLLCLSAALVAGSAGYAADEAKPWTLQAIRGGE